MNVSVTDEESNTHTYEVQLKDSQTSNYNPRKRGLIFVYIVWIFLFIIMGFAFFENKSTLRNEIDEKTSLAINKSASELKLETDSCKNSGSYIPFICLSIFSLVGLICSTIVLVKDVNEIRFAKLNALMSLHKEFNPSDKYETIEEELPNCNCCEKNNDNRKCSFPKVLKKQKSLYDELQKNLMNSIMEI